MSKKINFSRFQVILVQLIVLLAFYQGFRLLFLFTNQAYFLPLHFFEYVSLAVHGLRFDLSTVFSLNILYILLALCPLPIVNSKGYHRLLLVLFYITNLLAFLFELSDLGYFPYVRHRMTAEVFDLLARRSDFIDLLPSYLNEFWFVPIAVVFFILIFISINRPLFKLLLNSRFDAGWRSWVIYVLLIGISFLFIRGGLQLKPIMNANALLVAKNQHTALVLNTPFSILHTLEQKKLSRVNDVDPRVIDQWFSPLKNYKGQGGMKKNNVVVIILESFGKQYTGIGGRKSFTPFLDSLMQHSLVFTNAFANGHRSADGIPACLAGIPVSMEESFISSAYSGNTLESLASTLKRVGYSSSFFHGGTNGTMNFDILARSAGFDQYVGRTEYANDADYDGTWGIPDEPFLQFYVKRLSKQTQPFVSTVFTLSSHEPFHLPATYHQSELAGLNGIERGISYADHALRHFFESASKEAWYDQTLFVITADHQFMANKDTLNYYNKGLGLYSIPLVMYAPANEGLRGYKPVITQQIDILPTVLDYLNFPFPFFAFGNSALDSLARHHAYMQMGEESYFINYPYVVKMSAIKGKELYNFSKDSSLLQPILSAKSHDSLFNLASGFRQLLFNSLIENRHTAAGYQKAN